MSRRTYIAAGAAIGGLLTLFVSGVLFGVFAGAVIAWIVFEQERLIRRLDRFEGRSVSRRDADRPDRPDVSADTGEALDAADPDAPVRPGTRPVSASGQTPPAVTTPPPVPPFSRRESSSSAQSAVTLRRWLTTGNLPVKAGVIVSFFGVAFLLKYAVDRDLLTVPMWLRLALAALAGLTLLLIGWSLRGRMRGYALSLQGGGFGIVFLTVFAAYRLYGLLSPLPAFVLLAAVATAVAALAVAQNAKTLVLLALTGGFLAPLLVSTGPGSHVALFGYYLVLNVAVVGIAWFRSWRELNLAGFLFTFAVGSFWGLQYYRPDNFASVEPFLVAYFLLYQVAVVLFAFRQPPRLRGIVDGTLLFGTPVAAFSLQTALVRDTPYGLAVSALTLALFYFGTGSGLRRFGSRLRLLSDAFLALAVAFATVAVPLAVDARWTASTWAAEGAALVWLGCRQGGGLTRLSGIGLIVAAGAAFVTGGWQSNTGIAVVNGNVLGGALLSGAGLFAARRLEPVGGVWRQTAYLLLAWGVGWWLATGFLEIDDRLRQVHEYPLRVAFLAASAAMLSLLGRRLNWPAARLTALILLPCLTLLLLGRAATGGHPLQSGATAPWIMAGAAHLFVLSGVTAGSRIARVWHAAGVVLAALVVTWEIHWWVVVTTWRNAAISAALLAIAVICAAGRRVNGWPLRVESGAYASAAGLLIGASLAFVAWSSLVTPGDPLPWRYVPLLNPYDAVTLAALATAAWWTRRRAPDVPGGGVLLRYLWPALGLATLLLGTLAIVRGVHHLAGVSWTLVALRGAVSVQAALSIYWGMAAFAAMVFGTRRRWRGLWVGGATLMALVVVKLFLIDLGNSGTVARIVSFIGVGFLLLVVGYFSPAPPRGRSGKERS